MSYMKIFRSLLCVLLMAVCGLQLSAQKKEKAPSVQIRVSVVDEQGNPVPQAEISVAEGKYHYLTNNEGQSGISCALRDKVTISHEGYGTVTVLASILVDAESVVLKKDVLFAGENDNVELPFESQKKRYSLGSTYTIRSDEFAKYSSADIRNILTGVLPGVEVRENYGQMGVTPMEHTGQYGASTAISVTARGRQVMYLVDDVPVQINEIPLDPEQIESITIIRDGLEKTMYGPVAADGIISIKTKTGMHNERYLKLNVESGVNMVDRMPEFVNAAQYAALNNLARNNSGLNPLYTKEDIAAYAKNNPYDLFHPAVDFRGMMLKNTMMYNRASVSSGGGNDIVKYYAYLGYNGQDDMFKMGPKADYNNVSIHGNLDVKLHRYISAGFGVVSSIGIRRSPNYGYSANYSSEDASQNTTLDVNEMQSVLGHITTIPQLSFPVYADDVVEDGNPHYAVTSQYTQNPIANILQNGSYTETSRNAMFKVNLNIDLSFLTQGLSSYTYASFTSSNLTRLGLAEDYAAYILKESVDFEGHKILVPEQSSSHSVKVMSNQAKLLDYYSNRFYFVQKFNYARSFGKHDVKAYADYMITKRNQKFITEHRREMNVGVGASYAYDGRYMAQVVLNTHGTYSLLKSWSVSPSVGLGWIISEENFMKDVRGIDYLKIRAQVSNLKYDSLTSANRDVDNYSWNNSGQKFGPYTNNQWFGSATSAGVDRTYASMLGNPNLILESRKELSVGFDLTALDRRLNIGFTYYNFLQDGIITQMSNTLPLVAGTSTGSLYMNYGKTNRQGADFNISWGDKVGAFQYRISGWLSTQASKLIQVDELPYSEAYRSKVGTSASAIWGLKYVGQFASDDQTLEIPQLFDDALKAGDLRYRDMNGDGYVDDSDACVIGDSTPKLIGALNLFFQWKGIDLSITGTGRAFYELQLTNAYFWNGWGDSNYSKYTFNNAGNPASPRVTYNKVNNNYKLSSYWLADGSFFKIQAIELGYNFPVGKWRIDKVLRGARIYARANNVATFSALRDVDPEALSSGITNYPLMRTFVGGVKFTF